MYEYVPGPVAAPPWYGPLLPDLESFISMVFLACGMQNLIFPWYLHQFGWRTSFFHVMYSIALNNIKKLISPCFIGTN